MYIDNDDFSVWMQKLYAKLEELCKDVRVLRNADRVLPEDDNLLDNQDLCLLFKVSIKTLQRYRAIGALPYFTISGKVYYKASDVREFIKERLKVLFPVDDTALTGEVTPVSWYDKLTYRVTPYLKSKFFLLSAGIIICLVSLVLNVRFIQRMQRLQDNDIKYRYILMKGKADGSSLDLLETKFSRERDNAFIRSLTDSVKGFEYRSRKQAEALERARLLNEQAEQLREEADKLGKP